MNVQSLRSPLDALEYSESVTAQDIIAVRQLVHQVGVFNEEEIQVASELVADRISGKDESYRFILAKDSDNLLQGYCCFGEIPFTDKRYDLYWIVVAKSYQGTGLAKLLLSKTEQSILQDGGQIIYIETSSTPDYKPAQHFYFKNNYMLVSRLHDFYHDNNDKLIFEKRLKST